MYKLRATKKFHIVNSRHIPIFFFRKTEFFTLDGVFVPGPDLPYSNQYGCSVEVTPGIVFVAGGQVITLKAEHLAWK